MDWRNARAIALYEVALAAAAFPLPSEVPANSLAFLMRLAAAMDAVASLLRADIDALTAASVAWAADLSADACLFLA